MAFYRSVFLFVVNGKETAVTIALPVGGICRNLHLFPKTPFRRHFAASGFVHDWHKKIANDGKSADLLANTQKVGVFSEYNVWHCMIML